MTSVVEHINTFARRYCGVRMREVGYSHLLFSELRRELGDRFLIGLGANLKDVQPEIGSREEHLLAKYMPKAEDLYPDLVMFEHEILDIGLYEITRFQRLPATVQPKLLVEWKFTSCFPTMHRRIVFADAAKLEVLGDYLLRTKGHRPELLQVIFNFPSRRRPQPDTRVRRWFESDALSAEMPHVRTLMVIPDGDAIWLTDTVSLGEKS